MERKLAEILNDREYLATYLKNRYNQLENEFDEITYIVPITNNIDNPNYKFCSPKFADLLTFCCQDVDSLIEILIHHDIFDFVENIEVLRNKFEKKPSITNARPILNTHNILSESKITSIHGLLLQPFKEFKDDLNPSWFKIYSKLKHQRLQLIEETTLKDAINSFAAFTIFSSQFRTSGNYPEYRFFTPHDIEGHDPTLKFPYFVKLRSFEIHPP